MATGSSTRNSSLRVPISTEDDRALFQRRLTYFLTANFGLAFFFWLVGVVIVRSILPGDPWAFVRSPAGIVQLVNVTGSLPIVLLLRRRPLSATALGLIDLIVPAAHCMGWAIMVYLEGSAAPTPRVELVAFLAITYALTARAALLPSTPARSIIVASAATILLPVVAYGIHHDPAPAAYIGTWAVLGVASTTIVSREIYGLRREVKKAMQLGQYVLEDKIGEGGMGVVYRASHAMLRRPTAIKLLTGDGATSAERFEREVQITARLTHPNTIAIFDYGRTPEGVFYYAMEYLEGMSLQELVRSFGAQPPARVVHLLLQACGALEEAHANGLVHRDIKPANIMLTERGGVRDVVKVLDFGLVKETKAADPAITGTNAIVGTPDYLAPEAILDPATIDARTDLYAIGATAFFLLTGERVFSGASVIEICGKHLHAAPEFPADKQDAIPEKLRGVILGCLAKRPADRPADAAALATLLDECHAPVWSRADAQAWWQAHPRNADAVRTEDTDVHPTTMAITLAGRA